ncbi:unnamed protein product [Rotaria sordida]|uniref:Uncharacterized protein n=1 Tax=Rotaria sordida TaxID=392033 RepID=A0A815T6D2_9BILA|nr:unnamed protein product [Rotaria sordida]CAF1362436.1 unnamed protein product [Rotaria sordida]CAF1498933.1 unnamed protein product [Rotaria sordida]CAF4056928.1 unnamed protein product [Rotaria sordida]CAF4128473.1 unnamed protein product [Rotaria sordida]
MEVFVKEPSEHSHVPDPNRLHIVRLKNKLKERSASSDEGGTTILFDVLRKVPLSVSANLPTNEALLQTIRRERPAIQLDHNGRLPLILRQTDVEKISFSMKMSQYITRSSLACQPQ